jgi:hypothetical protein
MAEEKKSPSPQVPDLAEKPVTKKDAEEVKGGRKWDIPAGTASPSA